MIPIESRRGRFTAFTPIRGLSPATHLCCSEAIQSDLAMLRVLLSIQKLPRPELPNPLHLEGFDTAIFPSSCRLPSHVENLIFSRGLRLARSRAAVTGPIMSRSRASIRGYILWVLQFYPQTTLGVVLVPCDSERRLAGMSVCFLTIGPIKSRVHRLSDEQS